MVVIDELADLMMVVGKKIEELIARLAQRRARRRHPPDPGHQRPSVDVITGLIKANIPTRIAFQVSSKIDSRTILDQMGAEALLGMGDMLYMASGTGLPVRVHGAFVSDDGGAPSSAYLKAAGAASPTTSKRARRRHRGRRGGDLAGEGRWRRRQQRDPMTDQAVDIVLKTEGQHLAGAAPPAHRLQPAANLLDQMERPGMVAAMNARGQRNPGAQAAGVNFPMNRMPPQPPLDCYSIFIRGSRRIRCCAGLEAWKAWSFCQNGKTGRADFHPGRHVAPATGGARRLRPARSSFCGPLPLHYRNRSSRPSWPTARRLAA